MEQRTRYQFGVAMAMALLVGASLVSGCKRSAPDGKVSKTRGLASAKSAEPDVYDIIGYGEKCAELIAEAPPFDCRDGEIIPITVNGEVPEEYTRHMLCDRPAMLPYPEKTDGQCAPYSRIRGYQDGDIQMVLYCRRMYIREKDDPNFDSMEIIMHNVKTGSTCFFISDNFGEIPEGVDGTRVPPPTEEEPPPGFISARDMWMKPEKMVGHGCIYCHDSDPWMYSPWIAQTSQVPADPFGFHIVDVGGPFDAWPKPKSISTRGNTCTGCHRIGSLDTCGNQDIPTFGRQPSRILQSSGKAPVGVCLGCEQTYENSAQNDYGRSYPHSYWMPVDNNFSLEAWNVIYEQDVNELLRCCADHDAPGCIVEPITGKAHWLADIAQRK